jgi:hypothetical protein
MHSSAIILASLLALGVFGNTVTRTIELRDSGVPSPVSNQLVELVSGGTEAVMTLLGNTTMTTCLETVIPVTSSIEESWPTLPEFTHSNTSCASSYRTGSTSSPTIADASQSPQQPTSASVYQLPHACLKCEIVSTSIQKQTVGSTYIYEPSQEAAPATPSSEIEPAIFCKICAHKSTTSEPATTCILSATYNRTSTLEFTPYATMPYDTTYDTSNAASRGMSFLGYAVITYIVWLTVLL